MSSRRVGPYTLQAAIAGVHASAAAADATDWRAIVLIYDVMLRLDPSPIVQLNRAGGRRDARWTGRGPGADRRADDARVSYERALGLTHQAPERRFLERRLAELPDRK